GKKKVKPPKAYINGIFTGSDSGRLEGRADRLE
ncbi:hypothetical protein EVA_03961, partial [gut metagenome]